MSGLLGRDADHDPLDYSRILAREAFCKVAEYAQLGLLMLEDRDDDGADLARRGVVNNAKALQTAFTALAAAHAGAAARAAAEHFAREPATARQNEASPP